MQNDKKTAKSEKHINNNKPQIKSLPKEPHRKLLMQYYEAMLEAAGPRNWWPARTPFEVIIGAILTQNTAWRNVELAIENLRRARALTPAALRNMEREDIAELIRPAGYFNQKSGYIKEFIQFLYSGFGGRLDRLFALGVEDMRRELLGVKGIGRETADCVILYAAGKPIFVVDAYTRRALSRHGLMSDLADYDDIRMFFEEALPADVALFNEYHALLVWVGNRHCGRAPRCEGCPLKKFL